MATLSNVVFEAPCEDRATSRFISRFETSSKQYEHMSGEPDGLDERLIPSELGARDFSGGAPSEFRKQSAQIRFPHFPSSSDSPPIVPFHTASPIFQLADLAYIKVILHTLKYPQRAINGVLLGTLSVPDATVDIVDAIPLQHQGIDLTSTLELGAGMVRPA